MVGGDRNSREPLNGGSLTVLNLIFPPFDKESVMYEFLIIMLLKKIKRKRVPILSRNLYNLLLSDDLKFVLYEKHEFSIIL